MAVLSPAAAGDRASRTVLFVSLALNLFFLGLLGAATVRQVWLPAPAMLSTDVARYVWGPNGLPMGLPENATTVRVEDGKTLTTDGPFVGMKEAVGGWFILEADDLDAAIEVAARVPAARYGGAIEIRPSEVYW